MVDVLVVPVRHDYDSAYRVLALVNQERQKAGLTRLTMDRGLLDAAMKRAVECPNPFSHDRPNGTKCYTICPQKMNAENIAAGQTTPDEVFNDRMNSPGHRANILREGEQSIGIGCVYTGASPYPYWVQCFGSGAATPVSNPGNSSENVRCELPESWLKSSNFTFNFDEYYLLPGDTDDIVPLFVNQGSDLFFCVLEPSTFSWASSDSSVVRVNAAGEITGGNRGTATVTASLGSYARVSAPVYVDSQQGYWYSYGSGRWCFYLVGGSYVKDWGYIDGDWYYFDRNGWMKTGWQLIGDNYRYSSRRMVTG